MTNNTPTAPGPHYRRDETGYDVVRVFDRAGGLFYADTGESTTGFVMVEDDGLWRGPVPMPGEWAPRELFDDLRYEVARLSPHEGTSAYDALKDARVWDNQNPASEVTQ